MNKLCDSDCGFVMNLIKNDNKNTLSYPKKQYGSKLVGNNIIPGEFQGFSVAINALGDTLAVGTPGDNGTIGATFIFTKTNGVYTEMIKLVGTGNIGNSVQGTSVALNAAGNILAVGGLGDNANIGAVWIFIKTSSGTWVQETKIVPTDNIGQSRFGKSVSLNSSGNILGIGGFGDNSAIGAGWVWARSSTSIWTEQIKLIGPNNIGTSNQGFSVSLNGIGNIIAVGGYLDNIGSGAVWVWTQASSGTWTQQKLISTGNIGQATQGISVALNSNGNILAIGGAGDNVNLGATWIWTKTTYGMWVQTAKLVGKQTTFGASNQGFSTALNAQGTTLAVGGNLDNSDVGATWVFVYSGGAWKQQANFVGAGGIGTSEQGYDVALNSSGNVLAVGGPFDNGFRGAVWIFN